MKFPIGYTLFGAALLTLTTAQSNVTCKNGAHVIVARASNEPPGYGILVKVKDSILAQIPDSDSVAVPYPASIFPPGVLYIDSEPEGVGNLTKLVKEYGDACPNGKMALLGYSQGAHVIGDTLLGSDYEKFPAFPMTPGIEQKYIDQVFAVVMMGDPANVAGQPFLVGNSTKNGSFPRNNTANWAKTGVTNKIKSYCDANDEFCDSGKSLEVHIGYIGEYGTQAAKFVVDKFGAAGNSTSGNSTGSATPTGGSPGAGGSGNSSGGSPVPTVAVGAAASMTLGSGVLTTAVLGLAIAIGLSI